MYIESEIICIPAGTVHVHAGNFWGIEAFSKSQTHETSEKFDTVNYTFYNALIESQSLMHFNVTDMMIHHNSRGSLWPLLTLISVLKGQLVNSWWIHSHWGQGREWGEGVWNTQTNMLYMFKKKGNRIRRLYRL